MKYNQILRVAIVLLFFSVYGNAQNLQLSSSSENTMPLRIAYYGDNGIHPGLRIGTSYPIHEKSKVRTYKGLAKQSKKGSKTKSIQYTLDANLGFYNHPNNHFGGLAGIGLTRRTNKNKKSMSTAWSLEVNYLHRFYNIKTFEIDEDGSIIEVGLAGNSGLMMALAPSIEQKLGNGGPTIFLKPAVQVTKYNHAYFLNSAIELGLSLNLFK